LGHGISQYTPPEHVTALVEAVHQHSRQMRRAA
jgi:uroporphyrinogen decarboxylase